jgi:hypothetical protein
MLFRKIIAVYSNNHTKPNYTLVSKMEISLKEFKRRFNSYNACYNLVQNIFSSCFLSKHINIGIQKTIICLLFLGCETLSLTLRKEHKVRVFENRVLRGIVGLMKAGGNCIMRSFITYTLHQL